MKTHRFLVVITVLFLVASLHGAGQRPEEHYLKLKAETVGHLSVTLDAKSGKISAATLSCYQNGAAIQIRLTLAEGKEMHELVKGLDRQLVHATGMFEIWIDPPAGRMPFPTQYSLRVETIKAVPKTK